MRRRCLRHCLALAVALLTGASPLSAQGPPTIDIRPKSATSALSVAARAVLTDQSFDELLRNGFPTRLHFRAEIWTIGRWFDDVVDRVEWDIIVSYDLVDRTYTVERWTREGVSSLGSYSRFVDARAASELAHTPAMGLMAAGRRGYVTVQVDVQTLAISDLDEMQRWLQGEARPAVQGKRNPGTALTRGLRTLVTRLLGGEVRHLEARSGVLQF
ncbi:MAG: hypothetical protein ABMA00_09760 [Gemmatimonas sp.]